MIIIGYSNHKKNGKLRSQWTHNLRQKSKEKCYQTNCFREHQQQQQQQRNADTWLQHSFNPIAYFFLTALVQSDSRCCSLFYHNLHFFICNFPPPLSLSLAPPPCPLLSNRTWLLALQVHSFMHLSIKVLVQYCHSHAPLSTSSSCFCINKQNKTKLPKLRRDKSGNRRDDRQRERSTNSKFD